MDRSFRPFVIVVLLGAVGLLVVSLAFKNLGPPPHAVFEALLTDVDDRIEEVDGFVSRREGYDVHLRFRATDDFVTSLPYLGFSKASCEQVRTKIKFHPMRVAVWPPWRPETLEEPLCLERLGENAWSPRGRDYVLAEADGGWVYFSGSGREYDRNTPDPLD